MVSHKRLFDTAKLQWLQIPVRGSVTPGGTLSMKCWRLRLLITKLNRENIPHGGGGLERLVDSVWRRYGTEEHVVVHVRSAIQYME